MLDLCIETHGACSAVQIAGDDVPPDPATREMIQRRHATSEQKWWFIGEIAGHAEAEISGYVSHCRHQRHRIEQRDLHSAPQRGVRISAIDVVSTQHTGEEQSVETTPLQHARKTDPVVERGVVRRAVTRVCPHAVLNMADARHVESVEPDGSDCRHRPRHRHLSINYPVLCLYRVSAIRHCQAFLRPLVATVAGSVARSSFFPRPPDTGKRSALWRRSGADFARPAFAPFADGASARLRFKAAIRSITGAGVETSRGLIGSPFTLASISSRSAS